MNSKRWLCIITFSALVHLAQADQAKAVNKVSPKTESKVKWPTPSEWVQLFSFPCALVVAWLTVMLTTKEQRHQLLAQRTIDRLEELRKKSEEISDDMVNHLVGKPSNGLSMADSRKVISMSFKRLNRSMEAIKLLLPDEVCDKIENQYLKWEKNHTDDGFIDNKSRGIKFSDPRISKIQETHGHWDKFLTSLIADAVKVKLK